MDSKKQIKLNYKNPAKITNLIKYLSEWASENNFIIEVNGKLTDNIELITIDYNKKLISFEHICENCGCMTDETICRETNRHSNNKQPYNL